MKPVGVIDAAFQAAHRSVRVPASDPCPDQGGRSCSGTEERVDVG